MVEVFDKTLVKFGQKVSETGESRTAESRAGSNILHTSVQVEIQKGLRGGAMKEFCL
jgi:hypothetical protein